MCTLKIGDVLCGFEVIKQIGFDKYRSKYLFKCLKCGKTLKKTKAQMSSMICEGCKTIDETKKLYESLKDKIYKNYKCIGYNIKTIGNNRTAGFLIFECVNCGKTIIISIGRYKSYLPRCGCIKYVRYYQKEENIGDFIIKSTGTTMAKSRNIRYEATCKHCGYTLHGLHCNLVETAKESCKHHVYIDGKYIQKSKYKKLLKTNNNKIKKDKHERIKQKEGILLDKIYEDFKLYKKIHDRLDNELFHLNNDPKTKKKYEDVIKNMAKALLRWCE